jgi:hypothetical protein
MRLKRSARGREWRPRSIAAFTVKIPLELLAFSPLAQSQQCSGPLQRPRP